MTLDLFGVGEHHREEFLDAAPSVILAAAAAKQNDSINQCRQRIKCCGSSEIVSTIATLDLIQMEELK